MMGSEILQPEADSAVLSVRELQVQFNVRRGKIFNRRNVILKAVDGVTFDIRAGETFSIVGESFNWLTQTPSEVRQETMSRTNASGSSKS